MVAEALRVALLARPGVACDRLRGVLDEAGARRVLEADPTALELPALVEAAPQVVLVALDPATEDVLGRFDDVLFDPAIDVIYEEAELTASREGWDVARWQRHLVAKLQRHGDVLPPGREPDDVDAAGDGSGKTAPVIASTPAMEYEALPTAEAHNPFDPVAAESDDQTFELDESFASAFESGFQVDEPTTAPTVTAFESDADFSLGVDEKPGDDDPLVNEFDLAEPAQDVSDSDGSAPATVSRFGELSLDDGTASIGESPETDHKFKHDLSELERRISGLELVDDTPVRGPEQAHGAVLVLAGIGGPDAVRQLLGALSPDFPRPVLVQQRLDGARYDKLVAQMQRATSLPVNLAEPGEVAQAGSIYILPAEVGIDVGNAGIRFNQGGDPLAALPSADSAVLLLSGSDPEQVDAAMKHSWAGAVVAGQAADGCYDAAASNALAARGGDTAPAIELAQRLTERWS
ncbi:chemotaxis protein CheB [Novilysobacter erysipheiresistens]|uniref:protein-glutamate methylesterase n=1 Tax=Novilysobacter erysipheiresistens TaxID=1749332 RepID=A0ABU7Z2C8_9GAMM